MSDTRCHITWQRCITDGHDHAITDDDVAHGIAVGRGQYRALCGHCVTADSMLEPPGPPCLHCRILFGVQRLPVFGAA